MTTGETIETIVNAMVILEIAPWGWGWTDLQIYLCIDIPRARLTQGKLKLLQEIPKESCFCLFIFNFSVPVIGILLVPGSGCAHQANGKNATCMFPVMVSKGASSSALCTLVQPGKSDSRMLLNAGVWPQRTEHLEVRITKATAVQEGHRRVCGMILAVFARWWAVLSHIHFLSLLLPARSWLEGAPTSQDGTIWTSIKTSTHKVYLNACAHNNFKKQFSYHGKCQLVILKTGKWKWRIKN